MVCCPPNGGPHVRHPDDDGAPGPESADPVSGPAEQSREKEAGPAASVVRGSLGFAAVSLAAYAVWAFAGKWLTQHLKEGGFYAVDAAVFLGLSGLVLHPLVSGPGRVRRFLTAFVPAFLAYAGAWCGAWFALGFGWGEWLGSLGGCFAFALVAGAVLGNLRPLARTTLALFVGHSAGYFLGGPLHYHSGPGYRILGILGWGLLYGLGFGAGIGYAFHAFCRRDPSGRPV